MSWRRGWASPASLSRTVERCNGVTKNRLTRNYWGGFVVLAVCLGLVSHLQAFSVGDIDLQSAVNEPFRAEIRFVLEAHERDKEFEVLLGTSQDYQLEELERPTVLQHMHIILAPDKRDTVRIFSNVPIMDNSFDILVLLRSGKLTIVRNYHVELLESVPEAQQMAVVEPLAPPASPDPLTTAPPPAESLTAAPVVSEQEVVAVSPANQQTAVESTDFYGPIQRGETMYNIVGKLKVPRDQRWQAVVLLWRANHGAFLRGNLHGLLVGARLEVPADYHDRLRVIDRDTSQRIIASQWEAWRGRQVTTEAEAFAMTIDMDTEVERAQDEAEVQTAELPRRDTATEAGSPDTPRQAPSPGDAAETVAAEAVDAAEAVAALTDSVVDDETADASLAPSPVEPGVGDTAALPEEPVSDESSSAVAAPQVMRLPTDEGSAFVSTQELKLLLGNLESRLLRRLAPVQELPNGDPFVSPAELQVSLQNLENRLTQRVERIVSQGDIQASPEPATRTRPASPPPAGQEFIAGIQMPPVAYLLVIINVILLVFSLSLGWRWWRQR